MYQNHIRNYSDGGYFIVFLFVFLTLSMQNLTFIAFIYLGCSKMYQKVLLKNKII